MTAPLSSVRRPAFLVRIIATAAVEVYFPQTPAGSRKPAIVGDAAHAIVVRDSRAADIFLD